MNSPYISIAPELTSGLTEADSSLSLAGTLSRFRSVPTYDTDIAAQASTLLSSLLPPNSEILPFIIHHGHPEERWSGASGNGNSFDLLAGVRPDLCAGRGGVAILGLE